MRRSVVAAEDANFCLHWGFDMKAIRAALDEGAGRGASTISQQVVKNVYLWQGRSWARKAIEALLTPLVRDHMVQAAHSGSLPQRGRVRRRGVRRRSGGASLFWCRSRRSERRAGRAARGGVAQPEAAVGQQSVCGVAQARGADQGRGGDHPR